VDDTNHKGLESKDQTEFLKFYEKAMGRAIAHAEVRVTYDRAGSPQFEDCFRIEEILKYKCETPTYDTATNRY
jgi:hypothetical protein